MTSLKLLKESLVSSFDKFLTKQSEELKVEKSVLVECLTREVPPPTKKASASDSSKSKCIHILQKGKNPGSQCGESVCSDSDSYCRKHIKMEAKPKTQRSVLISDANALLADTPKPLPKASLSINLTKNAYGNHEHRPTGLVFSKETKQVVGRQVGEKILSLTPEDLENCKKYSFSYLPEAVALPESSKPTDDEVEDVSEEVEEVENVEVEEEEVEEEVEEIEEEEEAN
jgi:hypothetical protein